MLVLREVVVLHQSFGEEILKGAIGKENEGKVEKTKRRKR